MAALQTNIHRPCSITRRCQTLLHFFEQEKCQWLLYRSCICGNHPGRRQRHQDFRPGAWESRGRHHVCLMPLWSHAGNRKPSQRYQFTMPFGCFADPFWILLWWLLAFLMPTLGTCVEKTKFFEARLQCSNSNITGIMFATDAGLGLVGRANLQRSLFIAIPKPSFSTVDFGPLTGTVSWPRAASLPNPPHLWAVTIQWSIWMPCLHTQNAVSIPRTATLIETKHLQASSKSHRLDLL